MMNKLMRKVTSMLLVICMVMTLLPTAVFAGEPVLEPAEGWSIVNQDDKLVLNDTNSITVTTQKGDFSGSSGGAAENYWLRTPAEQDFTLTAKISGGMSQNYQKAGIMVYKDETTVAAVTRRYHTGLAVPGGTKPGNVLGMFQYLNGYTEPCVADPDPDAPVWLKLVKDGDSFTGYYRFSEDDEWTLVNTLTNATVAGAADLKIGVFAVNGNGSNGMDVTIEDFTYQGKNDSKETLIPFAAEPNVTQIWLSDLDWVSAQVGYSTAQKDVNVDGNTITLIQTDGSSKTYAKGLAAHAESKVIYDIEGMGLEKFITDVGVTKTKGSCGFIVKADDAVLYEIECIYGTDPARHIEVEIPADAKTLTLITTDAGIGIDGNMTHSDHSVWAGAYFERNLAVLDELRKITAVAPEYLAAGKTAQITVSGEMGDLSEADLSGASISYESSDEDILAVTDDGVITATGNGVATVTVTATLKGVTRSTDVQVIAGRGDESLMSITSPDGQLFALFALDDNGTAKYMLVDNSDTVIALSELGLVSAAIDFTEGLELVNVSEITEVVDEYDLIGAKVDHVKAVGNEMTMTFVKDDVNFKVIARMYDDGLAFRYAIDGEAGETITLSRESTNVVLPAESDVYAMPYTANNQSLETKYTVDGLSGDFDIPMLYQAPNGSWVLMAEANVTGNYCGAYLSAPGNGTVNYHFSREQKTTVVSELPFESPWRYFVVGTAEQINLNTMGETLNPDCEGDFSWVQPGATAWTWLNRDPNDDPDTYKRYIDFVADMGWEYMLLDEGWKPKGADNGREDKHYYGYFDWFLEVLEYANEKGVKLLVWENHNDLKDDEYRRELFAEYQELGIAGIKPDFFSRFSQEYAKLYDKLYNDCAEFQLLLNLHGAPQPTGERRTYPNLLTREAVLGHENELWRIEKVNAFHNLMIPFGRTAIGPADFTPMFSYRNAGTVRNFTRAHMAAMPVVFESGIQCLADRPDSYYISAETILYFKDIPAAWEKSFMPIAEPGERLVMVRQNGDDFYVGGMTLESWDYEMEFSFLEPGKDYYAVLLTDGETIEDLNGQLLVVNSETKLPISMLATGGFAMRIMAEDISADAITLDASELLVEAQGSGVLTATATRNGEVVDAAVTWTSSDETVATVTDGVITGISGGTVTVTATVIGFDGSTKSASCEVTVTPATYELAEGWAVMNADNRVNWDLLDETTATIKPVQGDFMVSGSTYRTNPKNIFLHDVEDEDFEISVALEFQPEMDYATAGLLIYAGNKANFALSRRYHTIFDNETLATHGINGTKFPETHEPDPVPNQGKIWLKIVKIGTTLTALWSADGESWTEHATVQWSSFEGKTAQDLKVGLYTGNSQPTNTKWATFSNFTIKYADSEETLLPFAVKSIVPVYGVELSHTEAELAIGDELTLAANVIPANAENKNVTWMSSNESIATVEDGVVTAIAEGEATITVTTEDGKFAAECVISVAIAHQHEVIHFEAVEPGCHYLGNIEYWYCPDCEQFWQDEALTQLTNSKNVILPATGGELTHFEAVEPGCHSNGNVEYWFCAECEGFWLDEACTKVTNSKSVILPATGGELVHFEAVEPGCHYLGNVEYWFCAECEGFWLDEACTKVTNSKSVILPTTGSENLQHVEAVEATHTENGNIEYWFCPDCEQYWQDEALTQLTNSKNVIVPAEGCLAAGFPDVDVNEWYHDAIDFAVGNAYMKGDLVGTFRPTDSITRAEMAQILYNIEKPDGFETELSFSDVAEGDWWYNAVMWAASEGLVKGDPEGTYRPEDLITREEMVTIIWRYMGSEKVEDAKLSFDDAAEASEWAVEPIAWAVEKGVVKGTGNNKYEPKANTERAAIAQVMLNLFG